jgi:hypothetical protein
VSLLGVGLGWAGDPCISGLSVGKKPGPYSFLVATGPQRGQSTCYICETGEKPAVIVFARTPNDALGKLVNALEKAVTEHKAADLRGWVTFLGDGAEGFEDKIAKWGRDHAVRAIPLGIFEDADGPPSYKLARDADVTVLLFTKHKVVANYAFRAGELNDERVKDIMKAVPDLVPKK